MFSFTEEQDRKFVEWLEKHEGDPTQLQFWWSERTEQASNNAAVA